MTYDASAEAVVDYARLLLEALEGDDEFRVAAARSLLAAALAERDRAKAGV